MSQTLYRCAGQVEPSKVGERVVLYHPVSRKAIVLNPTGSTLWSVLATPQTEADLMLHLERRYPSHSRSQLAADVSTFVKSLVTEGLLEIAG